MKLSTYRRREAAHERRFMRLAATCWRLQRDLENPKGAQFWLERAIEHRQLAADWRGK